MKKSLALFAIALAAVLNAATPSTSLVYKNTTTNALTGNIVAGNNTTISATGNGTITATALTGNITGNPTVSGNLTVGGGTATINGGAGAINTLTLGGNATSDAARVRMLVPSAKYNWQIGAQQNVDNGFEITPSTAVGGTTFSSPAIQIAAATGNTTINYGLSVGGNLTVSGGATATGGVQVGGNSAMPAGFIGQAGLFYTGTPTFATDLIFGDGTGYLMRFSKRTGSVTTPALTLVDTGDATFAGNVTVGNSAVDSGYTLRFTKAISGTFPRTDKIVFGSQELTNGSAAILGVQSAATGATGYLEFHTTDSGASAERMRLTSGGKLFLGTTDNVAYRLNVKAGFGLALGGAYIEVGEYDRSCLVLNHTNAAVTADLLKIQKEGSSLVTVNSSGQLNSGTSSSSGYNNNYNVQLEGSIGRLIVNKDSASISGTLYAGFGRNGSGLGSISQDGTSGVLYNTTSDARLKENVRDVTNSGAIIDGLKPRVFDWKNDGDKDRFGFLAQEVHAVFPQAVKKGDDGKEVTDAWAMDAAKLVPVLVAELKALRARVAALEAARN